MGIILVYKPTNNWGAPLNQQTWGFLPKWPKKEELANKHWDHTAMLLHGD
jgi:hypothetical protein